MPGTAAPRTGTDTLSQPILVACSHGTDNPRGRALVDGLRTAVARARPGLDVREAYVDVQQPDLTAVVRDLPEGQPAVVVPLLLSVGYHVRVDIPAAVARRPEISVAGALGPHSLLVDVLEERLAEAGVAGECPVVVAGAGSSDPEAASDVRRIAHLLQERRPGPVSVGFGSAASPSVRDAVAAAGGAAAGVAVAAYLLAPGFFHDRLADAGAAAVTAPLLPSDRIVDLVLERYDAAVAAARGG